MRRDSRLSVALHVLLHMAESDEPVTSEALGARVKANPVVLRRTLSGLRDAGIVSAEKGHGGGWVVARDLETVSVGDVYEALGSTNLFGIGAHDEATRCLIEQAVNAAVGSALEEAEALLMKRLHRLKVRSVLDLAASSRRNVHA